ncbi:MAG: hypothetical protein EA370_16090 [Wenzhouxiangella sp.]|nr:MAG: hypothetical protein EA370_16090 [Wenzhouxiangella sp.]
MMSLVKKTMFLRRLLPLLIIAAVLAAQPLFAQQAPTGFVITQDLVSATSFDGVPGFGNDYPTDRSYNLRFGQQPNGDPGVNARVVSFDFGGETYTRVLPPGPDDRPFDRVVINRVNNTAVDYEKVTAFFCQPQTLSNPVPTGTTVYFNCGYVLTMEELVNSFVLNRGSDNLFANSNSVTLNNIERVDMIMESGLGSVEPARTGFLLMERGGNDNFKMAAITSLDANGNVATLGPLITADHVGGANVWGNTGLSIRSTVFQSIESGDEPLLRPSQNLGPQNIHGTYISFDRLGIPAGQAIFGVALFPGDVTDTMDLIGLTDVPLDTNGDSASTGGLDFMAGGGFFTAEEAPVPTATIVSADVECTGAEPNPITLSAVVQNAGVVEFFYWQEGVSSDWTSAVAATGFSNPQLTAPPNPTEFSLDWDTTGIDFSAGQAFQIRVVASASFDLGTADTVVAFDADGCSVTGVPVSLAYFESSLRGGALNVSWSTAMEVGNTGFRLYGMMAKGELVELTDDLVESWLVDSTEPLHYQWRGPAGRLDAVFLEDIDVLGRAQLHGPFRPGQRYGLKPDLERIDWDGIRRQRQAASLRTLSGFPGLERQPLRLLVDRDGVYRLSWDDLAEAGLVHRALPVADMALTSAGETVPFRLIGHGHSFGPGTSLEFLGLAYPTAYSDQNVYLLQTRRGPPSRDVQGVAGQTIRPPVVMPVPDKNYVAVYRFGRDRVYNFAAPGDSPWADTRMNVNSSPRQWHFDFVVDQLVRGRWGGALEISLSGITDWPNVSPDHHVEVYLNGDLVADEWFTGQTHRQVQVELPPGLLVDGSNRLTLRMPADTGAGADIVNLDHFSVHYPRRLVADASGLNFESSARAVKITGLTQSDPSVFRLVDGRVELVDPVKADKSADHAYIVLKGTGQPTRWFVATEQGTLTPTVEPGRLPADIQRGRADYLIISHPDFLAGLAPLVAYHRAQGRTVRVVDVFDIYDQFSHGRFDARAIRDYIRVTAPRMGFEHVLLVGSDTVDYRNTLGSNSISFMPSLYARTGSLVSFAPADALFVDLDDNGVPDLPIGRLPVRTEAELAAVIGKTLDYASRPSGLSVTFAADRQEPGLSFAHSADQFMAPLPSSWAVTRAYVDELGVAGARNVLLDSFDSGAALTAFYGHSAFSVWTFDGLFSASDVANLSPTSLPTAVVQWGCWNSYHVAPNHNTMGHRLLLTEGRGAAVSVGSSTFSQVRSGRLMGEILMPILADQRGLSIGQAITQAKQELALQGGDLRDVLLGWTILGDPALTLPGDR